MPTLATARRTTLLVPTTNPSINERLHPQPTQSLTTTTSSPLNHPSSAASHSDHHHQQQQQSSSNTIQSMDTQFEPLDIIGTGSFGIIRKVKRLNDGLILARKELNYGRMDERDLRQLGEEVNILQNLRGNEHIVKYFERYVDKQNFMLYILMEYCSQGDLASVISRCRRDQVHLSEDTIWSYLAQIATALADCHSPEIVSDEGTKKKPIILHRDIKPENVFLNHFGLVKLGDFGLSKAMEMAAFTNTYVGTPYYMSPELINGQQYDVKSDIWALGCLIYELCAWHPPFHQAQTQPELAKLIREGKIPNLPRGYSSQLTALIKSMLRQDPKLRPDAKTILLVEQVKHQTRVLEVHRYARELTKKQIELEEREKALDERENKLKSRELKLQKEKDYFKTQQDNHVSLQEQFQAKFQDALKVIERANQIQRESEQEELISQVPGLDQMALTEHDSDLDIPISEPAPQRIPLSERRFSLNPPCLTTGSAPSVTPTLSYVHVKRMSNPKQDLTMIDSSNLTAGIGSPMKLDTPFKHLTSNETNSPGLNVQHITPSSTCTGPKTVRQVKTSKSLASLKSTYNFLTKLKSGEDTDSATTVASDDGAVITKKTGGGDKKLVATNPEIGAKSGRMTRRSESANGLLTCPAPGSIQFGNRRPTSTIGSISTHGGSTSSTNSSEPLLPERTTRKSNSTDHLQLPPTSNSGTPLPSTQRSPRYNHSDPDSLPSPFLKKKTSASTLVSHFLRPNSQTSTAPSSPRKQPTISRATTSDTGGTGIKRLPIMLQHIRNHNTVAPPVAARPSQLNQQQQKRTRYGSSNGTTGKPSLASRILGQKEETNNSSSGNSNNAGIKRPMSFQHTNLPTTTTPSTTSSNQAAFNIKRRESSILS